MSIRRARLTTSMRSMRGSVGAKYSSVKMCLALFTVLECTERSVGLPHCCTRLSQPLPLASRTVQDNPPSPIALGTRERGQWFNVLKTHQRRKTRRRFLFPETWIFDSKRSESLSNRFQAEASVRKTRLRFGDRTTGPMTASGHNVTGVYR